MPTFWALTKTEDECKRKCNNLVLYGNIGRWLDIDERDFVEQMEAIPEDEELHISLNSPGGEVFTAIAIYRQITRHKGPVCITIDGVAASAATIIASAPNARVVMPVGSMMMVHMPSTEASGNAADLRRVADVLDSVGMSLVDIYKAKTKLSEDEIIDLLNNETWLSPTEALKKGFCDEVDTGVTIEANYDSIIGKEVKKRMDKSKFQADYPELYNEIYNEAFAAGRDQGVVEGTNQERTRIKALEDMQYAGIENLVARAKFETFDTVEALAIEACKAERQRKEQEAQERATFLAQRVADSQDLTISADSNAGLISNQIDTNEAERAAMIEAGRRGFDTKKG